MILNGQPIQLVNKCNLSFLYLMFSFDFKKTESRRKFENISDDVEKIS